MRARVRRNGRIDIASIRRAQIVEAATAVIAEKGLQHLSLSEIENKVGMSRGQLTYYFKAKEEILLAVFDRLVQRMHEQHDGANGAKSDGAKPCWLPGLEPMMRWILQAILTKPDPHPEFHCLQFTFLSQIGHRADFRRRLARLYEEWRTHLTEQIVQECKHCPPRRRLSARNLATLVQAIFHGLAVQAAADPRAFDPRDLAELSVDVVKSYLWHDAPSRVTRRAANASPRPANKLLQHKLLRRRPSRRHVNGVKP